MKTDGPPCRDDELDMTSQERVAVVIWALAHGEGLRTRDIQQMTGLTKDGAIKMMHCLSRVIPIYQDDERFWVVLALKEGYTDSIPSCDTIKI